MIRREIIKLIHRTTGVPEKDIKVEKPTNKAHGDYSTNAALHLKKPADEIAEKFNLPIFSKVEVAGPGFINFFISRDYLEKEVESILHQREKFGRVAVGRQRKVNVESISANPTGPLHIGNGRNAFFGDVLANVFEKAGYRVVREYFINDAKVNTQLKLLGQTVLGKGKSYLSAYLEDKIKSLKTKLKNVKDEAEAGYVVAQAIQKDNKAFIEKKLKIKFDNWISEESFYKKKEIEKTIAWLKKSGLVYQEEGAWWLRTSKFGTEKDWVVVREKGEPTYLLSDIVYHKDKFRRGFAKVIDIFGADHQAHVAKIKAAAEMLKYPGELSVLVLQLVTLKGKEKISKRKGNVIALEELVAEIGLDAARFFYLQKSLDTHTEIDLTIAQEQSEKNPVFYIQYATARMASILRKSKLKPKFARGLLKHESELSLIKQLAILPEIVEDTANDYQVQRLPQYALSLAAAFHKFYRDCRVMSEDKKLTQARLSLVLAAQVSLKNTLFLMGISAPDKM